MNTSSINTKPICFKGPFHYSHIPFLKRLEGKTKKGGVYIWGFVYDYDAESRAVTGPADYENGIIPTISKENECGIVLQLDRKFIPYYVGKDSSMSQFVRLTKHHTLAGDTMKYIRFTESFMKSFFLGDNGFPIHYCGSKATTHYNTEVGKFIDDHNGWIAYFNSKVNLEKIYTYPKVLITNGECNHWPIDEQLVDNKPIKDILKKFIACLNNFWFCYATIDINDLEVSSSSNHGRILDYAEANTFLALKGQTISTIAKKIERVPLCAKDLCKDIFKYENGEINADIPHLYFPHKGNEDLFPGYINRKKDRIIESISHDLIATTL